MTTVEYQSNWTQYHKYRTCIGPLADTTSPSPSPSPAPNGGGGSNSVDSRVFAFGVVAALCIGMFIMYFVLRIQTQMGGSGGGILNGHGGSSSGGGGIMGKALGRKQGSRYALVGSDRDNLMEEETEF